MIAKRFALADSSPDCSKVIKAESTSCSSADAEHETDDEYVKHDSPFDCPKDVMTESTYGSSAAAEHEKDDEYAKHGSPLDCPKDVKAESNSVISEDAEHEYDDDYLDDAKHESSDERKATKIGRDFCLRSVPQKL